MLHSYMSDRGGLLLKQSGKTEILLSNGYGDDVYKYYVFHSKKDYNNLGTELNGDYITIYQKGTIFYFITVPFNG